jgi:hypothetical protein
VCVCALLKRREKGKKKRKTGGVRESVTKRGERKKRKRKEIMDTWHKLSGWGNNEIFSSQSGNTM